MSLLQIVEVGEYLLDLEGGWGWCVGGISPSQKICMIHALDKGIKVDEVILE